MAKPEMITKYMEPTISDFILFIAILLNIIILYKNIYIIDKFELFYKKTINYLSIIPVPYPL